MDSARAGVSAQLIPDIHELIQLWTKSTRRHEPSQAEEMEWKSRREEWDMRSCALTVCQVLTSEQTTEPAALWNHLPAGNQASSSSYGIGTAASGWSLPGPESFPAAAPGSHQV